MHLQYLPYDIDHFHYCQYCALQKVNVAVNCVVPRLLSNLLPLKAATQGNINRSEISAQEKLYRLTKRKSTSINVESFQLFGLAQFISEVFV